MTDPPHRFHLAYYSNREGGVLFHFKPKLRGRGLDQDARVGFMMDQLAGAWMREVARFVSFHRNDDEADASLILRDLFPVLDLDEALTELAREALEEIAGGGDAV